MSLSQCPPKMVEELVAKVERVYEGTDLAHPNDVMLQLRVNANYKCT